MAKKSLLTIVISLICFSLTVLSFNYPKNDPFFRNLKVLPKDISKKDLDSTMHYYNFAVGVKCDYCHAKFEDASKPGLDFASDANGQKQRAREMISMTYYINKNYFNETNSTQLDTIKTVTCYTCHKDLQ